jgi:hypothetical protein
MSAKSVSGGRLAVLAAAVGLAVALVALPSVAFAATRASTRIVVTKQTVVDWGTPGITPDVPWVTAKLQKKSKGKWVTLKGAMKVSYYDGAWTPPVTFPTASTFSVPLGVRGKYKFSYTGTSKAKTKSTYSYTSRIDEISETITPVTATIAQIDDTWTGVTVSYDVDWNTEAYPFYDVDNTLGLIFEGTFFNEDTYSYSGNVVFFQEIWQTGTVQFSYRVRTVNIPDGGMLETTGMIVSNDPYIRMTSSPAEDSTMYTP